MEKILKLDKVNKRFGGVVTALDVCMELEPGAIHGLIGPNGAGKTTLLNLISGIYEVDSGSITFMAVSYTHLDVYKRQVQISFGTGWQIRIADFIHKLLQRVGHKPL